MKSKKINWNYLLIAPALLISVSVILLPGIMTIVYSFTDYNGISQNFNFIGLQNFKELFHDRIFFLAIRNNLIWTIMFITIPVCIGMLAAMLLLSRSKTRSIYQVAFLIPYVLAPAVNAMLFQPGCWCCFIFKEFRNRLRIASCQHEKCDICLCRRRYLALLELFNRYLSGGITTDTDRSGGGGQDRRL